MELAKLKMRACFSAVTGGVGELLKAGDEGLAEALEAVAVRGDGGVLDVVEVLADLLRGVDRGGRGRR